MKELTYEMIDNTVEICGYVCYMNVMEKLAEGFKLKYNKHGRVFTFSGIYVGRLIELE